MLTLILTRHGQAAAGDVMLGGQLDVPLTPDGLQEAEALARRLGGVRIDRIISSPMLRAIEPAQTIATGRPVELDERLRELDYGRWESLTYAEIEVRDPELRARWEHDPAATHSPGGESGDDVAARALTFLVDLLGEDGGSNGGAAHSGEAAQAGDPGQAGRALQAGRVLQAGTNGRRSP